MIDIEELDDPHDKPDFPRANGAPMVVIDGKRKRLSRPSNYAKPLDDESALTNWRIDTACIGVANLRSLQARYVALDPTDGSTKKELREAAIQAGRGSEGSDIGTAVHTMTDRWEQDEAFDPPEPYKTQLEAYSAEMARLGLKSCRFEQAMVNVKYGAAGTCDRIYELTRALITPSGEILPAGTLVIGDTKTTRKIEYSYPSYSVQMFLYAGGQCYDVLNEEFIDTPEINQAWGIIMHIPSDGETCEAQWVDLGLGEFGAYIAQQVKAWRKGWRSGEYSCPRIGDPHDLTVIAGLGGEVITEAEADDDMMMWVETVRPWAIERVKAIGERPAARTHLTTFWPEGLPVPKAITTVPEMTALIDYLDEVEKRFELPFVPHPMKTKGHSSTVLDQLKPPS